MAWTEIHRALRRAGESIGALPSLMDSLLVLSADVSLLRQAGSLEPPALRSLDAIHLASALRLASQLGSLVTYDLRLAAAAAAQGIRGVAPGS